MSPPNLNPVPTSPMEILYLDDWLVAINKPAGMLVHRSKIAPGETVFALQTVRDLLGQRVYTVHRLDRPTSGLLIFARNRETAQKLSALFSEQRVSKCYLAVVRGFTDPEGVIDHPVKMPRDRKTDKEPSEKLFPALTRYRRLAKVELPFAVDKYPTTRYSLVEVTPKTGRRHQIRRHMRHISHHIIGDKVYGKGVHNRFFASHFGCRRLLLAAVELVLPHPNTGDELLLRAPLDDQFQSVLRQLNWSEHLPPSQIIESPPMNAT